MSAPLTSDSDLKKMGGLRVRASQLERRPAPLGWGHSGLYSRGYNNPQSISAGTETAIVWDDIGENALDLSLSSSTVFSLPGMGPSALMLFLLSIKIINSDGATSCNTILSGPMGTEYKFLSPMSDTDHHYWSQIADVQVWPSAGDTFSVTLWHDYTSALHVDTADLKVVYLGQSV